MLSVYEPRIKRFIDVNDAAVLMVSCWYKAGRTTFHLDWLNTVRDLLLSGF